MKFRVRYPEAKNYFYNMLRQNPQEEFKIVTETYEHLLETAGDFFAAKFLVDVYEELQVELYTKKAVVNGA